MSDVTIVRVVPDSDSTTVAVGPVRTTVVSQNEIGPPGPPGSGGGGGTGHHADLDDLTASGHPAAIVAFAPTGSIASTNVQAALAEIGLDYAASAAAVAAAAATALGNHEADTTAVHGIADTALLVVTSDPRLSDARAPSGPAGGVLGGAYPNPGFAVDMATQAELDAHDADATNVHGITNTALLETQAGAQARVDAAIAALVNSAPGTLDTLAEIATALGNDPNLSATLAASIATKLAKASNLSDVANAATARANLGLGSAATHPSTDFDTAGAAAAAQAASQPVDGDLTAIAGLNTSAFGRALLELVDAVAGRTALGLGTSATHPVADFLQTANNLSDVTPATARANLALGTAATANKVAAGNAGVLDATDATTTNSRTPIAHATSHNAGGSDALAIDAAAATGSLRTLGDGATQAAQGSKRGRVLASVTAAATAVNRVDEVSLCSLTVPGGSVAAGDHLRVVLKTDWLNNSGGNVNYSWRFKFGATTLASLLTSAQTANSARRYIEFLFDIIILDSTHQEIVGLWNQVLTATPGTWASATLLQAVASTTEDTAADKAFAFTIQMGTANALADYVVRAAVLELVKA